MATKKTKNEPTNKIEIERIYDAPVKAVWDAWTDPEQVKKWWGPRGFTITHKSKDLKPGGHWEYVMHGPDGKDWPNTTKYYEVEKYHKLVYDHGGSATTPPLFRVTALFTDLGNGKTKLHMTMAHDSVEAAERSRQIIKQASGNSTWDRLGEFLAKESTGKEQFIINRSFDVPLATMFEMWTNPKHFQKWLPPTGMNMEILKGEMKPGSSIFYMMGNDQMTMYGTARYKEIKSPNLLYTQEFSDKDGNRSRHPMAPTWPGEMVTKVHLEEEGPNCTRVTVTWEPGPGSTAEEIATFVQAKAGMTQGWTGSFDKLENYVENH